MRMSAYVWIRASSLSLALIREVQAISVDCILQIDQVTVYDVYVLLMHSYVRRTEYVTRGESLMQTGQVS